jgi:hypothetical protein
MIGETNDQTRPRRAEARDDDGEAQSHAGRQLDDMLAAGRSWQEVAEFASYSLQFQTLRLKPWETPPCDADDTPDAAVHDRFGYFTEPTAVALLKRMKAAGVSRFHPDPMRALAEAAPAA